MERQVNKASLSKRQMLERREQHSIEGDEGALEFKSSQPISDPVSQPFATNDINEDDLDGSPDVDLELTDDQNSASNSHANAQYSQSSSSTVTPLISASSDPFAQEVETPAEEGDKDQSCNVTTEGPRVKILVPAMSLLNSNPPSYFQGNPYPLENDSPLDWHNNNVSPHNFDGDQTRNFVGRTRSNNDARNCMVYGNGWSDEMNPRAKGQQYEQRNFKRNCIATNNYNNHHNYNKFSDNQSQFPQMKITTPQFCVESQPYTLTLTPTDHTVGLCITYYGECPKNVNVSITLGPPHRNPTDSHNSFQFTDQQRNMSSSNFVTADEFRDSLDDDGNCVIQLQIESSMKQAFTGLQNQGATCYISSLIQMLYHLRLFRHTIMFSAVSSKNSILKATAITFYKLMTEETADTHSLTDAFGWGVAEGFVQHDLHELNRILLDKLEGPENSKDVNMGIFEFKIVTRIKCTQVDFTSSRTEPGSDLGLDVEGCRNLEESLQKFVAPETMDGENKYDAGDKYGKQDAVMWRNLASPPKVLMIHLKRFSFDYATMSRSKVTSELDFPFSLDLSQYCDGNDTKCYHLYSVVIHKGSVESGHYFTYIRPNIKSYFESGETADKKWFQFNDENVRSCGEEEVLRVGKTGAYMLCYVADDSLTEVLGAGDEGSNDKREELPEEWETFYKDEQSMGKKRKSAGHRPVDLEIVFFNDMDINAHFADLSIKTTSRGDGISDEVSLDFFKDSCTQKVKRGLNCARLIAMASEILRLPAHNIVIWSCRIHEGIDHSTQTVLTRVVRVDRSLSSGYLREVLSGEPSNFLDYTVEKLVEKTSRFFYIDVKDDCLVSLPRSIATDPPLVGFVSNYVATRGMLDKRSSSVPVEELQELLKSQHTEADINPQALVDKSCSALAPQKLYFFISLVEKEGGSFVFELVGKCVLGQDTPLRIAQLRSIVKSIGGPDGAWIYEYDHYCSEKHNRQPAAITPKKNNNNQPEDEVAQIVIFQDPVPGEEFIWTNKNSGLAERNVKKLFQIGANRMTFEALPVTWTEGVGKPNSVCIDRSLTVEEAEEKLCDSLGSNIKLFMANNHGEKLTPNLLIGFSPIQPVSDIFGSVGACFYTQQVKGVKVAIWGAEGLRIENIDVDQWMTAEDIKSKLPQSDRWRLLYVRQGELVETVRPGESLQAYNSDFEDNRAHHCPTAKVTMLENGDLEYNFEGRKGAVEGVVFVAEPIERVEVAEGEGTLPSVVPVVVEIGSMEDGEWKRVGVPILSYLRKEIDTGHVLGERMSLRTGLSFEKMMFLGRRAGSSHGDHDWVDGEVDDECTCLWTYLRSQNKYISFSRGAGSETLGILGVKSLPHTQTRIDYDKLPRMGFHLSESALASFRASRAKFMQSDGVEFDEEGVPLKGRGGKKRKLQNGINIRDESGK